MTPRDREGIVRLIASAMKGVATHHLAERIGSDVLDILEGAGCVVVPRKATDDMVYWAGCETTYSAIWSAMLAASPFREPSQP